MFPILTNSLPMPPPQVKCDLNLGDDVGIITVDTTKPEDADSLAKQAKIIITTVGPYRYMYCCVSCVCCSPCGGSVCMLGWALLYMLSRAYPSPSQ